MSQKFRVANLIDIHWVENSIFRVINKDKICDLCN